MSTLLEAELMNVVHHFLAFPKLSEVSEAIRIHTSMLCYFTTNEIQGLANFSFYPQMKRCSGGKAKVCDAMMMSINGLTPIGVFYSMLNLCPHVNVLLNLSLNLLGFFEIGLSRRELFFFQSVWSPIGTKKKLKKKNIEEINNS
jgi:hypothetical protein